VVAAQGGDGVHPLFSFTCKTRHNSPKGGNLTELVALAIVSDKG